MGDLLARADYFEKKAGKKLNRWSLFGITVISPKYEAAAELYDKAANAFKLAESWDRAGAAYVKLASCHFELNSKHETANDFADAAHCYKKSNIQESIFWLERCVELFLEIEKLSISARYYEEIAELYEQQENLEKAILYNGKAADLFQVEDVSTCANQCMQKIAQFASQLQQYPEAIEIYEHIARQSLSNSLLKCGAKGYLLNAGICQLCKGKGDVVAIQDALERYLEMDPTFSETREYILLANLAAAIDEKDITKFTDSVRKYDNLTHLDSWKITLLLRVKEALKTRELEEDDFT